MRFGSSSPPVLTIRLHERGGSVVLCLHGELDVSTAPAFADAIAAAGERGARELALDVGCLQFVDSTGLHAILAAKALCERRSCEFAITRPTTPVERVLQVRGTLEHLPRADAEDERLREAIQI